MKNQFIPHLMATLLVVIFIEELHSTPLNPLNFTSLGTLTLSNGSFTIDTDTREIRQGTNVLFTGVVSGAGNFNGAGTAQFSGTGAVTNGSYVLLSSANVAMPLVNWVPVSTNPLDASGNFLLTTNPVDPDQPQEFYRLQPR